MNKYDFVLFIGLRCDLPLGDCPAREGSGQIREQSRHSLHLQEQTLLEEERAGRVGEGEAPSQLSDQSTDRAWEIPAQQGVGV